jgi:putative ABC transport system permease protein
LTALGSGALVGLAPAFQGLRWSGTAALRGDLGQISDGRFGTRARAALVVGQIAVATTLLIGAAVLAQSLSKALDADLGFGTRSAILATVELPEGRSADAAQAFYRTVVESIAALPGIEKAAIARFVPVAGTERRPFRMEGDTSRAGEDRELHFNRVSRDFFATMQTRLIAGRTFTDVDTPTSQRVVVVNELLANRYYGGQAVGKRMNDGDADLEIIGVVAASRRLSLQDPPMPVVFYPIEQQPSQRVIVIGRSAVDPAPPAEVFRRTLMNVDRSAAVFRTVTLEAHLAEALATNRLTVALVSVCGAMALLLSAVGIYGIVAFAVARRTREIGVRVALGAGPRQIFRLIVGEGGRVVAVGIGLGMLAALAGNRVLISMLYGVSASDPLTFLAVPALLGVVAVLAGALPALRALRLNPVVALRQE